MLLSISLVYLFFICLFMLAQILKDNSIADIGWGLGFILFGSFLWIFQNSPGVHFFLILFLTTLWGLRLSLHIFIRNKGKAEDYRYQEFRKNWGDQFFIKALVNVFLLQATLLLFNSLPIAISSYSGDENLGILSFIGIGLWGLGFVFETISDYQLSQFKKNPDNKGKIIQSGLWAISRHPNYFGEATLWWGVFLIASEVPFGWISIISPLLITYLLVFISGVPLLEKKYESHPDWPAYKEKTPVFIPYRIFLK